MCLILISAAPRKDKRPFYIVAQAVDDRLTLPLFLFLSVLGLRFFDLHVNQVLKPRLPKHDSWLFRIMIIMYCFYVDNPAVLFIFIHIVHVTYSTVRVALLDDLVQGSNATISQI